MSGQVHITEHWLEITAWTCPVRGNRAEDLPVYRTLLLFFKKRNNLGQKTIGLLWILDAWERGRLPASALPSSSVIPWMGKVSRKPLPNPDFSSSLLLCSSDPSSGSVHSGLLTPLRASPCPGGCGPSGGPGAWKWGGRQSKAGKWGRPPGVRRGTERLAPL